MRASRECPETGPENASSCSVSNGDGPDTLPLIPRAAHWQTTQLDAREELTGELYQLLMKFESTTQFLATLGAVLGSRDPAQALLIKTLAVELMR